MALPIWGDLDRAVNDSTKIDEAIAAAIAAHNDEPEAHLGADQSLETHRENSIIDHPAESVPNDKILANARAYVAIVDPASDTDFDSVDGAYAYALSKGGGNILITPGTYYLGTKIEVDGSVNLYGTDPDTCIIVTDEASGYFFETGYWPTGWSGSFEISNLTLRASTPGVFVPKSGISLYRSTLIITNSILEGEGKYSNESTYRMVIENSKIMLTHEYAIGSKYGASLRNVELDTVETSGVIKFIDPTPDYEIVYWSMDNVRTLNFEAWDSSVTLDLSGGALFILANFISCDFRELESQDIYIDSGSLIAVTMLPKLGENLSFYLPGAVALGCFFGGSGSTWAQFYSGAYIKCFMGLTPAVVDPAATVISPLGFFNYRIATSSQTVFDFLSANVWQKTPTSSQTYTATVPPAGEERTIVLLTSGTSSYTITFGSGFKTTGTLATGSTSARRFIVKFISDGTNLIETSRTTAIA